MKQGNTRRDAVVIPLGPRRTVKPIVQRRLLVIGDCENDTDSVHATLRFAGLLGKRDNFKKKARGAHIVQTGDLLYKHGPNPAVVSFWEGLREASATAGCSLHLVAGNHELEIWRRLQSGQRLGLKGHERRAMQQLIRTTCLFHSEGTMLFIHGYPTVKLLRHVQAYLIDTGRTLNDYNRDCFQPAFDDAKTLARYAYPQRNACRGSLLHDITDPARYYRRHGREVAELLRSFGVDLVVHGHRPERSGVQVDNELGKWLPGIRMINNDIQIRIHGLGATAIRQSEHGPTDLLFINKNQDTSAHRSDVRRLLRDPNRSTVTPPDLGRTPSSEQTSSFVRTRYRARNPAVARQASTR